MSKYVVADGYAFTANGHIYSAGEEISESVFSDKVYLAKIVGEKKLLPVSGKTEQVKAEKEPVKVPEEEEKKETEEAPAETGSKKSSKKSQVE